jgi:hypothetical protein
MSDEESGEEDKRSFSIRLLIKHPSWEPSNLTRDLGLTPHMTHQVGDRRSTPTGRPLPGIYHESAWSYMIRVTGRRHFFTSAATLIDTMESHRDLLLRLNETGGIVTLCFDLRGEANVGDVLRWRDLARLAALRVDLGVEVFP